MDDDGVPAGAVPFAVHGSERRPREDEPNFRALTQSLPNHVWTARSDGRLDWINEPALDYAGNPTSTVRDSPWSDAIHPDDRDRILHAWFNARGNGDAYEAECRLRRHDGEYRWFLVRALPIRAADGSIERWVGTNTDVHAQKIAEARTSRDRERSWTLSPALKVVATVDGTMVAVNPAWTKVLGWTEAESLGRHVSEFLAEEGRAEGASSMAQLARGRTMIDYQTTSMTKFGERRRIAWTTVPEGGLLYGFGRDVTEERRAAAALAASNAERERIWNAAHDLMGIIGRDGRLRSLNPAWNRLLGYPPSEMSDRSVLDFVLADDRSRVAEFIAHLTAGNAVRDVEHPLVHADGTTSLISWSAEPIGDDAFYLVGRDVTEQRRSQEALRQSQKMEAIGQLTGGIAHDFNNLVQAISGNLDTLQQRIAAGRISDLERFVRGAMRAAERASGLTHRLLAFSRRQPLDPKPVPANPLVASMEDLLRRTLGEHIELEFRFCEDLWLTSCDPHQLESALLNLAISVSDTGSGMSEDTLNKAFEPFFTTKPLGQGTGLGLSMVYGFARQSGGYVRLESRPGNGTTATLLLPRHEGSVVQVEPRRGDGPAIGETAGESILLVTDIGLPGLNGRQVADAARLRRPDLKVLFMTGYAENAAFASSLDPGMAMIAKPFAMHALAAKVRCILTLEAEHPSKRSAPPPEPTALS
jgi:PAS domain S-box-containing protein